MEEKQTYISSYLETGAFFSGISAHDLKTIKNFRIKGKHFTMTYFPQVSAPLHDYGLPGEMSCKVHLLPQTPSD